MAVDEANWAGNLRYRAQRLESPRTVDEVSDIVAAAARTGSRVRALGSRHSFNDIADTDGVLLSLARLDEAPSIDGDTGRVRVPAGVRYGELAPWLDAHGRALANLASLPHISVAGAVSTGTHGSGERVGSLATQVAAVELVDGTGARVRIERGEPDFDGSVVGLGALGVVTAVELDTEPTYQVAQTVFEGVRWDRALAAFDDLQSRADSVSLFTTWRDADAIDQVWMKTRGRTPVLADLGGHPADGPRHPLPGIDPEPCTPQQGVPGPWFDRLPHFRLAFTPSAGDELQSEYLVPRAEIGSAIAALQAMAPRIAELLLVCEVRTIAADELWLSPAYARETVGLHFTWRRDVAAVMALLPDVETALPPSARPHWGKLFALDGAAIAARYPRWDDMVALRARRDPSRVFANDWTARLGL
jgi:xylitol oxidase